MATLDDTAQWVLTDVLNRTDIQTMVRNQAVMFYKTLCASIPFDELMITSPELPIQMGVSSYNLTSGPTQLTPALRAIQSIRMSLNGTFRRLRRSHTRVYDSLSFIQPGLTSTYARWGNSIELNPPPSQDNFTFRVRYWSRPTLASPDYSTTVLIPDEWNELIKWETLFRAYNHLDMQDKANLLIQPSAIPRQQSPKNQRMYEVGIIPRLWNDLLSTVSQQERGDEDFSINPVVRNYSLRM